MASPVTWLSKSLAMNSRNWPSITIDKVASRATGPARNVLNITPIAVIRSIENQMPMQLFA